VLGYRDQRGSASTDRHAYLIHWPDRNTPFEEPVRALDDLREWALQKLEEHWIGCMGMSHFAGDR
jgi:aryl-alcohol dehydrogenase-like predicted oxidoreductase